MAAPRNMTFSETYGETVWNPGLLNLRVGFMLKVGGVSTSLERKSQESDARRQKVLHARGMGVTGCQPVTRL